MATLMGEQLHFYQLVYMSILSTACYSLPATFVRGPPFNLQMKSHNFQHILSWEAKSDPAVPTHYRVLYTDRKSDWMTAKHCSDIMQLSCNLTDDFKRVSVTYSTLVQSFVEKEVFNSSALYFLPFTDTFLGPPEVNISSCPNCLNITVKLPTSHLRKKGKLLSLIDIYRELDCEIRLSTPEKEITKRHEKVTRETFNVVIEELYPNRNYCVSGSISRSVNKNSISSPWKCATTHSIAQQDFHVGTVVGAVCFSLSIIVFLACMYAGGFILQQNPLPSTLEFGKTLAYSPFTFDSEKIAFVEVIAKDVKKKAKECIGYGSDEDDSDDDDDEDDDSESNARSDNDYRRRDIFSRVPRSSDTSSVFVQSCADRTRGDNGSQASHNPDSDLDAFEENEMDTEEEKGASRELLNSFSEVNCTSDGSRSSACFTINLKTVLLGLSEENVDCSAALLPSQEDKGDWPDSGAFDSELLDDAGSVQKPLCPDVPCEWQNPSSSDESDSSDSDMDPKTEYLRR